VRCIFPNWLESDLTSCCGFVEPTNLLWSYTGFTSGILHLNQYNCTVWMYSVQCDFTVWLYSTTVQCSTVQYSTCHKWGNLQWLTNRHSGGQCTLYNVHCTVYSTTVQYDCTVYSATLQYDFTVQLYSTVPVISGGTCNGSQTDTQEDSVHCTMYIVQCTVQLYSMTVQNNCTM
jgi:hypothetical protein